MSHVSGTHAPVLRGRQAEDVPVKEADSATDVKNTVSSDSGCPTCGAEPNKSCITLRFGYIHMERMYEER